MNKPSRRDAAGAAYFDLQNLARSSGRPTDELLQLYALEGFLDRLAVSTHGEQLVLKGGVLLAAFDVRRPTRDIDFAAAEPLNSPSLLREVVVDVLRVSRDDGLEYEIDGIAVDQIRTSDPYPGLRVRIAGQLSRAKIRFHVDVNVGDPIMPPAERIDLPRLRGGAPIELMGYTRELVVAEKAVTAMGRGTANTRWRDFVDIAALSATPIDRLTLRSSIDRVASYRRVELRPLSEILDGFADIAQPHWNGWRTKQQLFDQPEAFEDLLATVIEFIDPLLAD